MKPMPGVDYYASQADQAEFYGSEEERNAPKPPYPFCSAQFREKCIAEGRCCRTVRGEPWSCAE